MTTSRFLSLTAALVVPCITALADDAKSLLPIFGSTGREFTTNAKDGNKVKGWLPNDWWDNSEWAAVAATYSKLSDPPKEGVTAVRVKIEKVDEGQMQFTTWTKPVFKKGVKYVVEGWIRSKESSEVHVGARQPEEPYEFYAEQSLEATADWKRFTFEFTFAEDKPAFVMFYKQETGTIDLAGIVVREKK